MLLATFRLMHSAVDEVPAAPIGRAGVQRVEHVLLKPAPLFSAALRRCLKADSHIACRAHAAPMPFKCHAVR